MKIINLIEDTEGSLGCIHAHGLSFYVETLKHKLLIDLGPSRDTIQNAEILGVDLKKADTVILSHGHYDHSGGIIPFSQINNTAKIYMQETATGEYYADDGEEAEGSRFRYIGIDKDIASLKKVELIKGDYNIDNELSLFVIDHPGKIPFTNKRLKKRIGNKYIQDDFLHEHFLVIKEKEKRVLISGCAHNGILNILKEFRNKYACDPEIVISGFHLMKKTEYSDDEIQEIRDISKELLKFKTTFFTCHCTGIPAYDIMKEIMGEKLRYVHSGDTVNVEST